MAELDACAIRLRRVFDDDDADADADDHDDDVCTIKLSTLLDL